MFQQALIESLPQKTRSVGTVVTSASLHALMLGTLAWISLQSVGEIEDPPAPIIYRVGFAPPPLGDGRGSETISRLQVHLATHPRAPRSEQFQPTHDTRVVEPTSSIDVQDPNEASSGNPQEGKGSHGDTNGIDGGIDKNKGGGDGPPGDALPPDRVDQAPVLISRTEPSYPESAREHHLSGVVILEAIIGISGRVEDLRVVKSAGALLDAAALAAVEKWVYRPAVLNGRLVRVRLAVTVDFALH